MLLKIEEYKQHYFISDDDIKNLQEVWVIVEPYLDNFVADFLSYLKNYPETAEFFSTKETAVKRKDSMNVWLMESLKGPIDNQYLSRLRHVGLKHVKKKVPIHWVTASMNFKREPLRYTGERDF